MKSRASLFTKSLLLATAIGSTAAADETPWYQIELLLFASLDPAAASTEYWPPDPGQPATATALPLAESFSDALARAQLRPRATDPSGSPGSREAEEHQTTEIPFVTLGQEELQLTAEHARLAASKGYRPLLHLAWRQPVENRERAEPIHLAVAEDRWLSVPAAALMVASDPVDRLPDDALARARLWSQRPTGTVLMAPLEGVVKVWVARYLHLEVDLLYRRLDRVVETAPPLGGTDDSPIYAAPPRLREVLQPYRLTEHRRMRSERLHYFDHPLFGVLAVITPYTPPPLEPPPPLRQPEPEPIGPAVPATRPPS